MVDDQIVVIGTGFDALGTLISAIAEVRALAGMNDINKQLASIGEGLQAIGNGIIGTVETDDPLDFAGNWIEGAGAAASSVGAHLQYSDPRNGDDNIRIEILGGALQAMGASLGTLAEHIAEDGINAIVVGNVLQALGAGLEAIGGVYELNEREEEGQPLATLGAILQAAGANLNFIVVTTGFKAK